MKASIAFCDFAADVIGLTLTPAQRVFCRVAYDRVPPSRLDASERELARVLFGAVDDVPPDAFRVIVGVFGRGSGKDEIGAAYLLFRMLTADLDGAGPGDVPSAIVIAPDLKLASIAKRRAHVRAQQSPAIARYLEGEAGDGFSIRRPQDGRLVAFEALAATRAGTAARGRSVLGALLSECAFFRDESAAINDTAIYSAILPRLMRDGAILLYSTPWAEAGLFYELYEKNHGTPTMALVACAPTLVMRDNDPQIAALVRTETERDPINAERELGARFIGIGTSSFFDAASIDAAVDRTLSHPSPWPGNCGRACGVDMGFKLDSSAQVIALNQKIDSKDKATIVYVDEVRPSPGAPLKPSAVVERFAAGCRRYQMTTFMADQHYELAIKELAAREHLRMRLAPAGNQGKFDTYLAVKELFAEGQVRLPKHERLIAQFKAVVARPMPGGLLKIEVPRGRGQAHGDIVSAAVLALYQIRDANTGEAGRAARRSHMTSVWAGLAAHGFGPSPPGCEGMTPNQLLAVNAGLNPDEARESIWTTIARLNEQAERDTNA